MCRKETLGLGFLWEELHNLCIELCDDGVRVTLKIRIPCSRAGVQTSSILGLSRFVPLKMKRRGVETRIIIAAGNKPPRKVETVQLVLTGNSQLRQ